MGMRLIAYLFITILASGAFADVKDKAAFENNFKEAYSKLLSNPKNLKIISVKYKFALSGFVPVLVELEGKQDVAYYNGRYLVIGSFVTTTDEDAKTSRVLAEEVAGDIVDSMGFPEGDPKFSYIKSLKSHIDGKSDKVIYVFTDPFCENCIRFYKDTRDLVRSGKLEIHWISVAFRTPKSSDVAAYMVKNNGAFDRWYGLDRERKAGVSFIKKALEYRASKKENDDILAITNKFKGDLYGQGTPMIFYNRDNRINVILGAPSMGGLKNKVGIR